MATAQEIRAAALIAGRKLKRKNAIVAALCGAVPGLIVGAFVRPSNAAWLAGIVIGLLWSNAFEYVYHRYLLHWPQSSFGKAHLLHHLTTGTPHEPEQVTFGSSPLWVAILFATNGSVALLGDWRLGWGIAPGILVGFSAYMILVEEIHWRVHLGGWFPGVARIREYHLAHHDIPDGRYNVFFPVFDFIFGNIRPEAEATHAHEMARAVTDFETGSERTWVVALTAFAVQVWLVGILIGVRYFWTTKAKL